MSYGIWLTMEVPGNAPYEVADFNCTSNCAPMWRKAGCDLAEFHGQGAAALASALSDAIDAMEADMDSYRAMNPPNGWGDADGCLAEFLKPLFRSCLDYPDAKVSVSR